MCVVQSVHHDLLATQIVLFSVPWSGRRTQQCGCREAMDRLLEAIQDYKEAIVLEPKSKEAQSKLASARQKLAAGAEPA